MASGTTVPSYGAIQYPETYSIVIHGTLTQQYWWPNNEHDTNLRIPSQPSGPSHYLLFGFIFMAERGTTTCPSLGNIRHTSIFDHFLTKSTHTNLFFFSSDLLTTTIGISGGKNYTCIISITSDSPSGQDNQKRIQQWQIVEYASASLFSYLENS